MYFSMKLYVRPLNPLLDFLPVLLTTTLKVGKSKRASFNSLYSSEPKRAAAFANVLLISSVLFLSLIVMFVMSFTPFKLFL